MPDDAIVRRLCALLSEACGAPEATLGATSSPRNLEAWDSFSNLTLMLSVEEEYGVKFATSDMINLKVTRCSTPETSTIPPDNGIPKLSQVLLHHLPLCLYPISLPRLCEAQ